MSLVSSIKRFFELGVVKKFGEAWMYGEKIYGQAIYGNEELEWGMNGYGFKVYGFVEYGSDDRRWGIYQKRHSHWKLVNEKRKCFGPVRFIRMNFMFPKEPGTPGQVANWNKFKDGMAEWKLLTREQKDVYNKNARKYRLHGVNLFLREWLNSR